MNSARIYFIRVTATVRLRSHTTWYSHNSAAQLDKTARRELLRRNVLSSCIPQHVVFEKRTIRQNNSTEQLTSKCFVEMLQNPTWYSHNSTKHFVCNILGDTSRPKVVGVELCWSSCDISTKHLIEGSSCAEKAKHFDKTFRFRNVCRAVRIPRWVLQQLDKTFRVFDVELFDDVELFVFRIPRWGIQFDKTFRRSSSRRAVLSSCAAELCEYHVQPYTIACSEEIGLESKK